jgi:hypothetical protein
VARLVGLATRYFVSEFLLRSCDCFNVIRVNLNQPSGKFCVQRGTLGGGVALGVSRRKHRRLLIPSGTIAVLITRPYAPARHVVNGGLRFSRKSDTKIRRAYRLVVL